MSTIWAELASATAADGVLHGLPPGRLLSMFQLLADNETMRRTTDGVSVSARQRGIFERSFMARFAVSPLQFGCVAALFDQYEGSGIIDALRNGPPPTLPGQRPAFVRRCFGPDVTYCCGSTLRVRLVMATLYCREGCFPAWHVVKECNRGCGTTYYAVRPHTPFPPVDNGGANPRFLQVGESDLLYEVPDGRRHRSMQATVRLRDPRVAALSHGRLPREWWHVGFDGASTPGVVGLVCDSQAPSRGRCLPLEKRGRELTGSLPPVRNGDRRQEGGPERTELLAGPPYRHRSLLAEDAHRQSVAFAQVQPVHQVHRRARGDHARPSRVVRRSQQRERPEVQDVGLCRGSAVTRGHEVLQHVRTGVRMEMRCHEPPHSTGCSRTLASLPKRAARRTLLLPGTCEPGRGLAALQQDGRLVRPGTRSKGGRGCREWEGALSTEHVFSPDDKRPVRGELLVWNHRQHVAVVRGREPGRGGTRAKPDMARARDKTLGHLLRPWMPKASPSRGQPGPGVGWYDELR
ncbi:unnamed protein product [Ectocarpus fasciculatus]